MPLERAREAIARFNERVDSGMERAAPTKEWVRGALRRQGAPRCPVRLRRVSLDVILRYGDALADLFCAFPDDALFVTPYDIFLGYQPPGRPGYLDVVQALTQESRWTDEWGTTWRHVAGGVGASAVDSPLQDWSDLDALLRRLPDPLLPGRLDGARPALARHAGQRYVAGSIHMILYERFHCLRGMVEAFADFHLYPAEVERLLEALAEYCLQLIGAWGRLGGVDGLFMTDDWGTQQALMVSPQMWRAFFAARYRRLCDAAHAAGLQVIFHSCGNVTAIVGDLIDAGVDVIEPLQPEAMDLPAIAREFGGHVAFCGGLSDQAIAHQTPREVRDMVRRTLDTMGRAHGNAYLAGPSNVLTPEIPLANIEAMFEACHEA